MLRDSGKDAEESAEALPDLVQIDIIETPLYKALKQYCYETSKAEGIKAFYIYNNAQLEALIKAMPRNLDELGKIYGYWAVKCEKYGEGILGIVDM